MNDMNNNIINEVKSNIGTDLETRLGITREQIDRGIGLAHAVTGEVVKEALAKDPATVRNLYSSEGNTKEATALADRISTNYASRLTKDLGLNTLNASAMRDAVLPRYQTVLTKHANGKEEVLRSLVTSAS